MECHNLFSGKSKKKKWYCLLKCTFMISAQNKTVIHLLFVDMSKENLPWTWCLYNIVVSCIDVTVALYKRMCLLESDLGSPYLVCKQIWKMP